ncbi:zwei Ig domain protein zig-8-like [Tachypleus tridentatus]|uniref:zwei Ig domain protein zig-8-like n=1 Tax=Tachypleus tridentatus TaxID=6853 RepID=UPI003FD04A7B
MLFKEKHTSSPLISARRELWFYSVKSVRTLAGILLCFVVLNRFVEGDSSKDELIQKERKRMVSVSNNGDYWLLVQSTSPSFDQNREKNITTQLGQTVYLHCIVNNLGDKAVAWIRRHDLHLLTVGTVTYINDNRFSPVHVENTGDWSLQIKYPQLTDAGLYECQVSSDPKISFFVNLRVLEPKAEILGVHPLYVKTGNSINLTCVISDSPELPVFVFWYHNDRMINYDTERGMISLHKWGNDAAISTLYITDAQLTDSGNYSCGPSNAEATGISVFCLNGENPAAIQRDASTSQAPSRIQWEVWKFILLTVSWMLLR